jgi:flagellar hook-associated protein 2
MVSQIQFGNIFNSGGRQVLGGSNSGYDTEALVNGLADAKRLPAVKLESRIEQNGKRLESYTELQGILNTFKDAANFLRNPPGVANASDNIFEYRTAALTSNSSVSASNYLGATIEPGASLSNYTITVDSIATYDLKTLNTFSLASTSTSAVGGAGPLNAGTYSIGAGAASVTLIAGDTLQEAVNKFNAVSDTSGVDVSIIQVSAGNYRLQFKSSETGTNTAYILPVGMYNTGLAINQAATDAQMTIDGTQITRSTNDISDAIDGITFNLQQTTPLATEIKLNIEPDTEIVKAGILNFVDSYNQLRLFVSRQTELGSDGKPVDTAILSNSGTLRNTMANISSEIARVVDGLSAEPNRLSSLGITFTDFPGDDETPFTRKTLVVDEQVLDSALATNFNEVRKVFEFDYTSTDSNIQIFRRTNSLDVTSFTLNLDPLSNIFQATYMGSSGPVTINLTASTIPGGGYLLEGGEGTPLEGLQLISTATVASTSSVALSQGIGDRIYNALDDTLNETTGSVAVEISSLETADTRMQDEITRIDDIVSRYRQQLLEKFANLEKILGSINSILASLDANTNAQNNN